MSTTKQFLSRVEAVEKKRFSRSGAKLTEAQREERHRCESSFYEFVKHAWVYLEGRPYIDGWHVQAICEHLQALQKLEIRDLLLNIPFRHGKSLLAGALFSAWCWTIEPELRLLYTAYAQKLSTKDSVACRRLITSEWYQRLWGHKYRLMRDVNNLLRFDNSKFGYRIASSVSGAITGFGGDIICVDDPNNIFEVQSEVIRDSVNNWWDNVMSTRFSIAATGRRLVIQQRCHISDLSGHILAKNDPSWIHLCLPAEYEKSRRSVTIPLPMSNNKVWMDPRKKEGELLWPQGMGADDLEKIKRNFNHDSYIIACQLQQRPSPEGGGILREEWFKTWKQRDYPEFDFVLQSWDTSLTKKDDTSCYNACTTWGIFKDSGGINNIMLLSVFKEKMEYPDLRKAAVRLAYNYEDVIYDDPLLGAPRNAPDMILIEEKVSGYSLLQDLGRANLNVMAFNPGKYKGRKVGRCRLVSHLIENGLVWLPAKSPTFEYYTDDSQMFLSAALTFPCKEANDVIDSMSQAFIRLTSTGWVANKEDPVFQTEPNWRTIDKPYD